MKPTKSACHFLFILSTFVVPVFAWMLTQMGGGTLSIKNFGLTASGQNVSYSLVNIFTVHATTNNRHTMKLKDMAVGQVVTLGNRKFVRVSENTFQGVEAAGIMCGTHSSMSKTDVNTCVCDDGWFADTSGNTSHHTEGGSCNIKYMQDFTAAECDSYATPTGTNYTTVGTLIDSRDGKAYIIRKFADGKCWMAQNLAYGNVSSAADFSKYSYTNKTASGVLGSGLYGVAASPGSGYEGYLYDWQAAMQRSDAYYGRAYSGPTGVQGICPTGWHVPTGDSSGELQTLSDATGTNAAFFAGGNFCASGTSCLAGGIYGDGSLDDQGSSLFVWSSTPYSTTDTNFSYFLYAYSGKVDPEDIDSRYYGFSVRCVRDEIDCPSGSYYANGTCVTDCPSGTYADDTGRTYRTANETCEYKQCGSGTTGTYVDATSGTCTCSTDKFANSSGATTVAIATGTCTYNKYCTGSGVTAVYATSAPSSCTCASGKFSSTTGGTTTSTSGTCTYNKYCTGTGVTAVYATSAPSSCNCATGKFSNATGGMTTTTSGSCSTTTLSMNMQAFTAAMCNHFATPTGTNYTTVGTLKDTRSNTSYVIRKFSDGKCWMAQNLAYGNVSSAADFKTYSYTNKTASGVLGTGLYGVATSPGTGYEGYLYNWQAVMQRADAYRGLAYSGPTPVQGICPTGWHVPTGGSSGEFKALSDATGTNAAFFAGGNFCASGTSCLAGYLYGSNGSLSDQGSTLRVWSSSPYSTTDTSQSYYLYASSGGVNPAYRLNRSYGFSVRCVRDPAPCPEGKYANANGDTETYDGTCNYNKYCTGNNVVTVYATSTPSSCHCTSGYANGTNGTTTLTGSCVAFTSPLDYSSQFTNRTMQSFTSAECDALPTPVTTGYVQVGTFKDSRDNKSYVIRKFADGKCWMAQNLAYGTVSDATTYSNNARKSVNGVLGNGLYGIAVSPGTGYEGYLYNWQAAMQDASAYYENEYTGPTVNVQGICPTGWHIPTGNSAYDPDYETSEFKALSDVARVNDFFYGGNFCSSGSSCLSGMVRRDTPSDQGSRLHVWSSIPFTSGGYEVTILVTYLYTSSTTTSVFFTPKGNGSPADGNAVRCVKD